MASQIRPLHTPPDDDERAERETLLGLYHGYDQARLELARLVSRFGSCAQGRQALGIRRGAHAAALSSFIAISDKAEALRSQLGERWPELDDAVEAPSKLQHD